MMDKSFAEKEVINEQKKSEIVVGLDIGTTKIACFVGRKNEHGKIEIIAKGKSLSLGVGRGVVENIDKTVDSILSAIKLTEKDQEGRLKIASVYVGIAGQHIKSMQHRGIYNRKDRDGEISQKDIDSFIEEMYNMVMSPGEEIITVIPQEYIVDNLNDIKEPVGMPGRRLEANFHIITGQVHNVINIRKCVDRAGLKIKDIILEPIASADAVLSDEEKEAGVVLVDIGGGTTDIAIFHNGIIRHTAVIPFGGNIITQDIREGCKILQNPAESLKVEFGCALATEAKDNEIICIPGINGRNNKEITKKNLAHIIQARMEEIIELVEYEIKNSGYHKKLNCGIVVTGGGAQLKHLPQLFEFITGMDTRIGYPNEHLANTNNLTELASPIYSTGIGLVMKGFETIKENVSMSENDDTIRGHSNPEKRGGFFDKILKSTRDFTKEFFSDDND